MLLFFLWIYKHSDPPSYRAILWNLCWWSAPKLCSKTLLTITMSCSNETSNFFYSIYSKCKFRSTIMQPNWFFDLNAQCTCYKMKHRHYFKCKLLFYWVNIIMPNFSLQDPRALKLLLMWAQWQINRGSIDLNSNSDDVTFWFLGTIQFL